MPLSDANGQKSKVKSQKSKVKSQKHALERRERSKVKRKKSRIGAAFGDCLYTSFYVEQLIGVLVALESHCRS
jgi:hypothetical protein